MVRTAATCEMMCNFREGSNHATIRYVSFAIEEDCGSGGADDVARSDILENADIGVMESYPDTRGIS